MNVTKSFSLLPHYIAVFGPELLLKKGLCPKSCANVVPPVRGAVISSLP